MTRAPGGGHPLKSTQGQHRKARAIRQWTANCGLGRHVSCVVRMLTFLPHMKLGYTAMCVGRAAQLYGR
jgi:hypothetical protein